MKASSLAALLALVTNGEAFGQEDRVLPPLPFEGKASIAGTLAQVDVSCILRSWRIKGAMACVSPSGGVRTCLWVENAWPSGILEVVRQPYKTHYAELKGVFAGLTSVPALGDSSSHAPTSGDGTAKQFAEARVYTFVPDYGLSQGDVPLAIPSGDAFSVSYLSELDGFAWRSPIVDSLTSPQALLSRLKSCSLPDPRLCAGTWGGYYPRIGFLNHESQVMAAYVQALRAGRAASMPLGRVALGRYPFEPRTGHYIQMLAPSYRTCTAIGSPLIAPLEKAAGSKHGAYLFLHYGVFEVCRGCLPVRLTSERAPF